MKHLMAVAIISCVVAMSLFAGSPSASAHEHRLILGDRYEVVMGWKVEPAVSGEVNSIDLRVSDMSLATPAADGGEATGAPVEGLETTLTADVIFADQTRTLPLRPRFRAPGAYDSYVIPVTPGDYSFHIYGTINGEAVDETFTPGPETFSSVADRAELEFPSEAAASDIAPFGTVSSSSGFGGIDAGTGMLAAIGGLIALAGSSFAMRRRSIATPMPATASSMGD